MNHAAYLLDTDYVIDFLKGQPHAVAFMKRAIDQLVPTSLGLCISMITYAELYDGLSGITSAPYRQVALHFLRTTPVEGISKAIAKRFASIRHQLRVQGRIIPDMDIFIVATAIHHNLTLVTRSLKDYERIPDLKLYKKTG